MQSSYKKKDWPRRNEFAFLGAVLRRGDAADHSDRDCAAFSGNISTTRSTPIVGARRTKCMTLVCVQATSRATEANQGLLSVCCSCRRWRPARYSAVDRTIVKENRKSLFVQRLIVPRFTLEFNIADYRGISPANDVYPRLSKLMHESTLLTLKL